MIVYLTTLLLEVNFHSTPLFVGFGIAFIHVLSGPDHLAAVTPLVLETKYRHWKVGLLWGLGHVLGMSFIGLLFLFFKELIPIEKISMYSEQLVGGVLILLGIWTIYKIKFHPKTHNHPHIHQNANEYVHIHPHQHTAPASHQHPHSSQNTNSLKASIIIGIVHGFAGISHFILFSPILSYSSQQDGLLYIIGFTGGTITSMVLFAYLLGLIAIRSKKEVPSKTYAYIRWGAGILAILVGLYWVLF